MTAAGSETSLTPTSAGQTASGGSPPKRRRADYHAYYQAQCAKFAPRTIDWDHHAFESVLGLLMFDYPDKTESQCVIALANMELYAPLVGPRESNHKR